MRPYINTVRKPVKRVGGEEYLLITLLSFAASVSVTRLFLFLTGYPQLGGGRLHIAHLMWGGLLLFAASLLPLIYANRWVYRVEAILAGVGVGLFIDEVGKFITSNNDYFYPPAAPIIYAFFLIMVLVYTRTRRPPHRDVRTELFTALESMEEVLDHDLDATERAQLEERLRYVVNKSKNPDLTRLARELLDFVCCETIYIAPQLPTILRRTIQKVDRYEQKLVTRLRFKALLAGGLAAMGALAFSHLLQLALSGVLPAPLQQTVNELEAAGRLGGQTAVTWYFIRLTVEGAIGLCLLVSSLFLIIGRERRGLTISYFSLLIALTTVDLLIFYYDQFSTIVTATIQFILLLGTIHYRNRYIRSAPIPSAAAQPADQKTL